MLSDVAFVTSALLFTSELLAQVSSPVTLLQDSSCEEELIVVTIVSADEEVTFPSFFISWASYALMT